VSAGVDWLTVTTTEPVASSLLALHIAGMVDHQKQIGFLEKAWGMSGFSGMRVGEVEFGRREDEFIVRIMSDTANRSWRQIYALGQSVTRLDLQVTVEMHRDCQPLVWEYYRRANLKSAALKRGPKNHVILGNDGGATLYCGERSSTRFGRCYAKGPQSKLSQFKTCLRFELQLNGKLANSVAGKLALSRNDREFAYERSVSFFMTRIGRLPVPIGSLINDSCSRRRSDVRDKLDWFRKAVRPSVQMLSSLGYRLDMLRALGLDDGEVGPGKEFGPDGPSL